MYLKNHVLSVCAFDKLILLQALRIANNEMNLFSDIADSTKGIVHNPIS